MLWGELLAQGLTSWLEQQVSGFLAIKQRDLQRGWEDCDVTGHCMVAAIPSPTAMFNTYACGPLVHVGSRINWEI